MTITYVSVAILIDENNRVLLEKNTLSSRFKGLWQFPGGKLELNETPFDALKRELQEELSIEPIQEDTAPLSFIEYTLDNQNSYVVFFYICRKWIGNVNNNIEQSTIWIDIKELINIPILPYNKPVISKLLNS